MIDTSLREIVKSFQAGSRDAFAKLVQRYQNLVTSVAFANTGDLQRSEDIAQQAFLVAWQKQEELIDPDRFGGWIRGIANNLARNDRRLKSNVNRTLTQAICEPVEPTEDVTPDQLSSRREQSELLWATLDRIPMEYREPLILYYREEHSVAAVAEQMGLTESAVKQRLKRGRAMVKQEIESMVENFLIETRPSANFSAGVMAAIPVAGSTLGSAALKAGAAIGAKATAGKLTTGLTAGAIGGGIGILGGLFGLFAGIGGAWIGTHQGIKHATSEEERQLHRRMFAQSVMLSIGYTIGLLATIFFLDGAIRTIAMVTINVVFVGLLGWIVIRFSSTQRMLHRKFGRPKCYGEAPVDGIGKPVSVQAFRLNAFGMTIGVWCWLILLTLIIQSFVVFSISLAILSLQLVWIFVESPNQRESLEQIRFNAKICWIVTLTQAAVVLGGYLLGAHNFDRSFDGVPIWACGLLVFAIGGFVAWLIRLRANAMERDLNSKPSK